MSTKHLKALRLSVSLLIVGGLAAALFHGGGSARAEVTLVKVEESTVTEAVKASGLIGARQSWPVASASSGTIREILVSNGQQVAKGDVIVRLASEETTRAAQQATALHKNAVAQKQMFDAALSAGAAPSPSQTPLSVLAASLGREVGVLSQTTSQITAQAQQPAVPSAIAAEINELGTSNVLGFLQMLMERRGDIQRVAGDLGTSAISVQRLVQTLISTLNTLESGDASMIVPSVMELATQASSGLGDMVKLATALQEIMGLLTLPPAAAGDMPADLVSSILGSLGGQRGGMTSSLTDLGTSLDKAQKSLVDILGTTVSNAQSSMAAIGVMGAGGMSTALAAYVDATASMLRSASQKQAALELRAPEAGLVALGSAATPSAPMGSDASSLLGGMLGGGGDSVGGAINTVLGGLTGESASGSPQPLISVGSDVGWGQKLFTVYDVGGWTARVTVDESKISRLSPGMPTTVTVTSLGKVFPATVTWISPVGSSSGSSVSFALEAGFTPAPEDAALLRIGTKADVAITLNQVGPAAVVRMGALTREGSMVKAFVVRGGKTIERVVTVLATDGVNAAVDGIEAGDEVILAPIDIKDGQAVKAVD